MRQGVIVEKVSKLYERQSGRYQGLFSFAGLQSLKCQISILFTVGVKKSRVSSSIAHQLGSFHIWNYNCRCHNSTVEIRYVGFGAA